MARIKNNRRAVKKKQISSRLHIPLTQMHGALDRLATVILFGAGVYLLYRIWGLVGETLFPVVAALLLAYLLNPFILRLKRRGLPMGVAILSVFASFLFTFAIFFMVLYPVIVREIGIVVERFPIMIDAIQFKILPWLRETFGMAVPTTVSEALDQYGAELKNSLPALLNRTGSWALTALTQTGGILSGFMNLILIPLFTLFFLKDLESYRATAVGFIPEYRRERVIAFLHKIDHAIGSWFRGQIQVILILALVYGAGLAVVFGLSGFGAMNGFAIGALTGLLNIIPYVGVGIGLFLSLAMALIEWGGIYPLIGIAVVFIIAQIADGYFITPRIVGGKVGLGTVGVLIALLIGGALFGLAGMLFAVPCAAMLRAAWPDLMEIYRASSFYRGEG
jgi:predicted PurR-regulated permease PerM